MLNTFKSWLIERIEIIENANNSERFKIYNPKNFMIIEEDNTDKNKILVDIMDALYSTHTKFKDNGKIVKLNFNVIYLIGYLYPEWKVKVGKNFIPLILDSL